MRGLGWTTRRPVATAAALYLVLSLVMFSPALLPGRTLSASDHLWTATPWDSSRPAGVPVLGSNREMVDSVTQFQPALEMTRAALPDIPLWNPYILGGRPFLGDPQSAIFSPFSVPTYVLPFWRSFAIVAILKLFLAALGAFLLGRELRMRFGGALLTGLVFGFSLWSVKWVSWTLASVWVFLPWLCLLCERSVRRPGLLPFAGLATVVGLQWLGGHPSSSFQILVVVALAWVARALASAELRRRLGVRLLTLAAGLIAGTALAAVMLIPFAELLLNSSDLRVRSGASDLLHAPPRYLLGIFLHDWWGSGSTGLELTFTLEHAYYVGALPLMLAMVALVAGPTRARLAVAAVGALTLAIATGLPMLYDLVVALPGLEAANNARFAVVTVLCLAVLAGWGLSDLTASELGGRRRRLVLGLSIALVVLPVAIVVIGRQLDRDALGAALRVAWGFATPTSDLASEEAGGLTGVIRLASVLEWLVLAALALALLALRVRGRVAATPFVVIALLLVGVDLFKAGMGYNPAIAVSDATQPTTPALRYLAEQRPARFAGLQPRAAATLTLPLPPNLAMRYGLYDTRGYAQPTEERYFETWRRAISPSSDCYYFICTVLADTTPRALRALGLLGASHLLQNHRDPPLRALPTAYAGPDARIYRNPSALPRAFLVDRQVVAPGGDAALALATSESFRPRVAAVTEERIAGLREGVGAGSAAPGRARIVVDERERVVVETEAGRPALMVLTDSWFPGWEARVNGERAPIHRVNYVTRGVRVPAGRARVELRYEPVSVRAGFAVSGAALLVLAAAAAIGWRRRRSRPLEPGAAAGRR